MPVLTGLLINVRRMRDKKMKCGGTVMNGGKYQI